MFLAQCPRRIVTFDDSARDGVKGRSALLMMPATFTTGDYQRFARMGRIEAEIVLDGFQCEDFIKHEGNIWRRKESAYDLRVSCSSAKRMQYIFTLITDWVTSGDFSIDALCHSDMARLWLNNKCTEKLAERKSAIKDKVRVYLYRRKK